MRTRTSAPPVRAHERAPARATTADEIRVQWMLARELARWPGNPKNHDLDGIEASFARFGYVDLIIIDEGTNRIVAGHGRAETLERMRAQGKPAPARIRVIRGEWYVPVLRGVTFENPEEAEAYLLTSNRLVEKAGWDPAKLAEMLKRHLKKPEGIGWQREQMDEIVANAAKLAKQSARAAAALLGAGDGAQAEEVDEPERPKNPVAKPGQIWQLGHHLVLCGDSRKDQGLLMGNKLADCVFTDPPYGVDYEGKTKDALKIQNDERDEKKLEKLLMDALGSSLRYSRAGAVWYVFSPQGPTHLIFLQTLKQLGVWRQVLIWQKDVFVLGHSDFHYDHEPLIYGWKPGRHRQPPDRKQKSVWPFARPKRSEMHPTMKPVKLVAHGIGLSTVKDEIVLDPFGGSGTTLIACEQIGRVCRTVERDPGYVDVIIARWQELTGKKAKLLRKAA